MATDLNYANLRIAQQARESDDRRCNERRRNLLYLVLQFLIDEGYWATSKLFISEAKLKPQETAVCDNIDLDTIVQEFESYYFIKFQKHPRLCKRISHSQARDCFNAVTTTGAAGSPNGYKKTKRSCNRRGRVVDITEQKCLSDLCRNGLMPEMSAQPSQSCSLAQNEGAGEGPTLSVVSLSPVVNVARNDSNSFAESDTEKLFRPLIITHLNEESKELAEIIAKDIYLYNPNVHWSDIIGLDGAKRLLKESVVYPVKYPELFSGILAPWKGLLLYGPPGTGKTLLAKAVATECKTTFFNISASSIVSKWRGDSEKLVRVLFDLARQYAPSTIFVDELDALASHRDGLDHEASRRLKSELLIQLDGLSRSTDLVFLLATSNLPWELDPAMLRRLEKRILVDLPNLEARKLLMMHYLPPAAGALSTELDYSKLAEVTEGYSGSDIKLACKEAAMEAMRQVFSVLESCESEKGLPELKLETVTTADVNVALGKTKPSAAHLVNKYHDWQKEFESS